MIQLKLDPLQINFKSVCRNVWDFIVTLQDFPFNRLKFVKLRQVEGKGKDEEQFQGNYILTEKLKSKELYLKLF